MGAVLLSIGLYAGGFFNGAIEEDFTQAELQIFFDSEKINEHEKFNDVKNYEVIIQFAKNK